MGALQDLADAESEVLAQWEQRVQGLIRAKGGSVSARDFQRAINVHFHDEEAAHYDDLHQEMWESLQPIFNYLVADIEKIAPPNPGWTLVDVGCGTGLATELTLRTSLKHRISKLLMVDTSAEMLARCRRKASHWGIPAEFVNGQLDAFPDATADILITSSVLHHIPDLVTFCREISRVVKPGGFYLHMQDSPRGALASPAVRRRSAQLAQARNQNRGVLFSLPGRLMRAAARRLRRLYKPKSSEDYLDKVNRRLIAEGLIKKPLTPREIWSITDLRVGDLPYAAVDGVSADELAIALPNFECISMRTYGFFGVMPSHLPPELAAEERRLFEDSSNEGAFLAGAWVRRI